MLDRIRREALDNFRRNAPENITLMLAAGLISFAVYLLLDIWFGFWCLVASVVFAGLILVAKWVLDRRAS